METTVSNQAITNPTSILESMSCKDFILGKELQVATQVRTNTNGYPFITFIDKENKAENIYFSKTTSPDYKNGMEIKRGFFDDLQMVLVQYEDDREPRWKISKTGGNRLSASDLF